MLRRSRLVPCIRPRRTGLLALACLAGGLLWSLTFAADAPAGANGESTGPGAVAAVKGGALRWERQRVDLRLKAGEKKAGATFAFVNGGDRPVRITGVESSCGCTAGKPDREVYAPGERGELRVEFNAGSRRGVQANWIDVRTDEGAAFVRLNFVVVIPEPLTAVPRLLTWTAAEIGNAASGDEPGGAGKSPGASAGKSARLQFDLQETGKIERVEATSDAAWLRVETASPADEAKRAATEAGHWRLHVTPSWHEGALPWRATVTVTAHTEKLGPVTLRVFAVCR